MDDDINMMYSVKFQVDGKEITWKVPSELFNNFVDILSENGIYNLAITVIDDVEEESHTISPRIRADIGCSD